jgi:hypothetical protein
MSEDTSYHPNEAHLNPTNLIQGCEKFLFWLKKITILKDTCQNYTLKITYLSLKQHRGPNHATGFKSLALKLLFTRMPIVTIPEYVMLFSYYIRIIN